MKAFYFFLLSFLIWGKSPVFAQDRSAFRIVNIAFYNLENLFDIEDNPFTYDDDRTPKGKDHWTREIYQDKISKMAYSISRIGRDLTQQSPIIIGLCELENLAVLEDLIQDPVLREENYGIIHYDSPDLRGIDVALLYKTDRFVPSHSVTHELEMYDRTKPSKRIYTRDQLVVSGILDGEEIHLIINHWPSRSGGVKASSYKREQAAQLAKGILDSLQTIDPYSKIIIMGDFNDDPVNKSISEILNPETEKAHVDLKELFNPMAELFQKGIGSLAYRDSWNLFDQILLSQPFVNEDYSGYQFYKASVFNAEFLVTPVGQYKGYPFRSFGFGGYTGGYSDHFPVFISLLRKVPEPRL